MLTSLDTIAAVALPPDLVEYRLTGHHYGWPYDVRVVRDGLGRVTEVRREDGSEPDDALRSYAETTAAAWAIWPIEGAR